MTRVSLFFMLIAAAVSAAEEVDLLAVNRIRSEAFERSQVMDHLFYLTDVYGPRISDSPNYKRAAQWAIARLKGWGIDDAGTEPWGTFGRSWSDGRFWAHMTEPAEFSLMGMPMAFTPSTAGRLSGEVLLAPMRNAQEGAPYRGKLRGKIVMLSEPRQLTLRLEPDAMRFTDAQLRDLANTPEPSPERPGPAFPGLSGVPPLTKPVGRPVYPLFFQYRDAYRDMRNEFIRFLKEEGVAAVITEAGQGNYGTVFMGPGLLAPTGSWDPADPEPPTGIILTVEHYNRMARLLEKKMPVRMEMEVRTRFYDSETGMNVIANLPGGAKRDEVVMIGAHLDSWHGGTGAIDDASGCAIAMEAIRILKTLGMPMDRTVRLALWDAEEQGLLGSRGYVARHFLDRDTRKPKPEYSKLSVYFNVDDGTGKVRGVYLQGNDMARPIIDAWLAPFRDVGVTTTTLRGENGTDHLAFNEAGLPGFQVIQDWLDLGSRTHHSNMDLYDHAQPADMRQASAVLASFVYNAATRPSMMPRKPMPQR